MKQFGRKWTLIASNAVCGICMLLIIAFPSIRVVLATIALTGMSSSFPTVYLYAGELFPTGKTWCDFKLISSEIMCVFCTGWFSICLSLQLFVMLELVQLRWSPESEVWLLHLFYLWKNWVQYIQPLFWASCPWWVRFLYCFCLKLKGLFNFLFCSSFNFFPHKRKFLIFSITSNLI